jgi:hypothetical protein
MPLPKIPGGLDAAAMGQLGADYIADVTDRTGDWCIITAIAATTFTVLRSSTIGLNGASPPGTLDSLVLDKGLSLYGRFTRMQLAVGGRVVAYKSPA